MPKPITAGKQVKPQAARMSVVLLTMDNHLASAAEHAAERLAAQIPGLHLQTHHASAWRDSDKALSDVLAAVAQADIVIVTMLFMEDHFLPVLDALKERREHCDAMVCIMSAPQVTQLTRMGKLVMGRESGGLMALLKRPLEPGEMRWEPTDIAPADWPAMVTREGSPPNALMLSLVHCMARRWSIRP